MRLKIILATLTLSFCTGAFADATMDAINAAKDAKKEAGSLGFEWRDMDKTIKKAEAAAKAGDSEKAMKLANVVTAQLIEIKKQAALAPSAGPRL